MMYIRIFLFSKVKSFSEILKRWLLQLPYAFLMTVKIDKTNPSRKKNPQKLHTQKKVYKKIKETKWKHRIIQEHY